MHGRIARVTVELLLPNAADLRGRYAVNLEVLALMTDVIFEFAPI